MRFKYSEYTGSDGNVIFRPVVVLTLKHGDKFIQTEAVIDSGADFTILPIEIAGILCIKLDSRTKTTFHGAGSNAFTVYPSPVKIEHMLRQGGFRTIKWSVKVFFAEAQPTILLGYQGFLERFRIILDGKKKELEIAA
ncbi:hypothetical protein A3J23_02345 [Candidatus Peregrinibacteria bacterium RIFCSPLOWO2_02_FULL_48_14]|nr:MAG: hypothetical protein A2974_00520 [Candidatus Peregrinibacteria bacterium RIFCSPLOWO2_01_FULL_48_20]OGJ43701.1 MAG: hypothetical protein A3J23_02345 [Candidatus Peregrinibacteria bacterium RIFCSPLOWO2_02_FULL_48_14]